MRSVALRDTAASIRRSVQDPLGIYLNDHLAGATAGLELARRVAGARQVPATGPELQRFADDVAEDRAALMRIMGTLGVPVRSYKVWAAWAGEKAGRAGLTQVGRALEHLGVEHIAAYSPQARGRSERAFQTLQDRLPKELTLAGIATIEAANVFIRDIYVPSHNARFAVPAEQEGSAFVAVAGVELAEILCIQEERQVGNDNCVRFKTLRLQIPESPLRAHFVKATVRVRQYPDGRHAIFHGKRCLGRYDQKGVLQEEKIAA